MDIGFVKFIKPKDPLLLPLIKGYYVHTSEDPNFYTKVTFYQNITTTISIYKDSKTSSEGRLRQERHNPGTGYKSLLAGLVDKYQEVEFFGPINRLAIVFYPLGINHFINVDLSTLLKKHYSYFDHFGNAFDDFLDLIYDEQKLERKRDLLDHYFLNRYNFFNEIQLKEAVDLLQNQDSILKTDELSKKLNLSRRTLLRKFKKHTGYTIEEYVSVIKFRKALYNFQKNSAEPMTQIALASNYYDQADFNHNIKNRSNLTPKELFAQLNIVDDTLFWKV